MDAGGCTEEEVCMTGTQCDTEDVTRARGEHGCKISTTRDRELLACGLCEIMEYFPGYVALLLKQYVFSGEHCVRSQGQ